MKKMMLILLSAAFFAACAGGSEGGPVTAPNLDNVQEGAGAALDLSGSPEGSTTDTEVFVKSALEQINRSFSSSTSSSTSAAPADGFSASMVDKAMTAKAVDTTSALYRACTTSSYTQTINKQITGISGTANFTGSVTVNKISDEQASASESISGTFENFNYRSYTKDIKVDGTANMTGSGTITKGFKELCDAATSGQIPSADLAVASESHQQVVGSFSVSGQYGAAMTFDISTDTAIDTGTGAFTATTSGTANVKSGGKIIACTVNASFSYGVDPTTYKVICI